MCYHNKYTLVMDLSVAGSENKILVVDDEVVIRELLTDILTEEGHVVESVGAGAQALDTLRHDKGFFILFADIMMPGMSGIELIREARKLAPTIIPIVMTGFATLDTARDAVREGAYDYVLKPFSLSEIKMAVANAVDRHRLMTENARLRDLTELFRISEAIAGMRNEQTLLDFILKAALERVDAERGSLMLITEDGQTLEIAASVGVPEEATKTHVRVGTGISGWVAKNVRPLLVSDLKDNPDVALLSQHLQDPSFVSVPIERKAGDAYDRGLRVDGPRVLAVLNITQKRNGQPFTEGDLKVLSIVANHAAAAIENVRLIKQIEEAHLATLESMALLLEAKDPYTHGHSERVRDYCVLAAHEIGLPQEDCDVFRLGAALHDIGKIGVADAVLNKGEPLTPAEWESIKRHPVVGYDVLSSVRFLTQGHLQLVRHHHERIDGTGYPDGLAGDSIPVPVRIISVADAYDAMSSSRAYRQAMPTERVLGELRRGCDTQFDVQIVHTFLKLIQDGKIQYPA